MATTDLRLEQETIQTLSEQVRGQVLVPGDEGYDEARSVFNAMIDRRPALIVRCSGTADVISAVNFARAQGLTVSVRGGAHNVAGHAVCEGGMMIDLSQMKSVWVDPAARTARAEGGATWGDVDHETQAFGLAVTGGQISHTGIGGLTLGGGVGHIVRKFGLVIDNLISVDVVTADGRLLRASETENPDLFWGIRGGGGNFGIVTSFEYRLHPLGPIVAGGMAMWPAATAPDVLHFLRDHMKTAADELQITAAFITAPPAPFVPEPLWGAPMIAVAPCYAGPLEEGLAALELIRALKPELDMLGPIPYVGLQQILNAAAPFGYRQYWKSGFIPGLSDEVVETLLAHAPAASSPLTVVLVLPLGGAIARVPQGATAFGHREAGYDITIFTAWTDPTEDAHHIAWTRDFWTALQPLSSGVYVNGLGDEEDRVKSAYDPSVYARLVEVKNRYDPTNFFHLNQNIKPTV